MKNVMMEKESGLMRIRPSIFNSRWYYLGKLRKNVEEVVDKYIKGKNVESVLDFGCGNMPYKSIFSPHTGSYLGADIPENESADLLLSNKGIIPLDSSSIDIVISTQVLEHVPEPKEYLNEAYRVLKDNGFVIISTHGYWIYHPTPTDYWRWTSAGLRKIIVDSGYEIVHFKGIVGRSAMGLQLFQDGFIFKLPAIVKLVFVPLMQFLIMLFDKTTSQKVRNYDAGIYIVVAQKKTK